MLWYSTWNKADRPKTAKKYHPWGGRHMTGKEFKELRKKMGLTQKQLALPLGVTYQTVQKWESRGDEPAEIHARHWQELSNVLVVPVDIFYSVPEEKEQASINANGNAVVISGGRDASQINNEPQFILRPLERQAIELNREFGNDSFLKGFIDRLLQIKTLAKDMY